MTLSAAAPAMRVERLSWLVLIACFALFCLLCITLTLGLYTFTFISTVPLNAQVEVSRGTALLANPDLTETGARETQIITGRVITMSMDSQAQALIALRRATSDSSQDVVATATLFASSEVRFQQATMPRFAWTNAIYSAVLRDFRGQLNVVITPDKNRPFVMDVYTANGRLVRLNGAGRYSIEANETRLHVVTIQGEAMLFTNQANGNRIIPQGSEGVIYAERAAPSIYPARKNLVDNGLFMFESSADAVLPNRWGCSTMQDDQPRGIYQMDSWEGRPSLHLVRAENASSHGETRCFQPVSTVNRDITPFNYLELEASFLLNYQSLPDCGTRGSECPLMLRMTYTDINNVDREWFQGFYTMSDPAVGYPPRCESCTQDHLQVNEGVWYVFETGNLFTIIPTSMKPARINTLEFYASGHQYDVYVGEISLNAGYLDTMVEVNN